MKTKVAQHVSRIIFNVFKVDKFSKFSGSQRLSDFQDIFSLGLLFYGDLRYTAVAKTKVDDVCPVCGISLLRINLARHLRTHDENPQFRCEFCDKFLAGNQLYEL